MNRELPDVQAGFRKSRGTRDQTANIHCIIKQRCSRKTSISASLTMQKPLTVWITTNHGKFVRKWQYHTPYLSPEKPVCRTRSNRIRQGTMDWFKIRKGVCQGYQLPSCLFNLYTEYIMQNAGLGWAGQFTS